MSLKRDARGIALIVKDNGQGVPRTTKGNGKGMGLHIMSYRANVAGGRLTVKSALGTSVTCLIPAKSNGDESKERHRQGLS